MASKSIKVARNKKTAKKTAPYTPSAHMIALEPRMMFDGAGVVTAIDTLVVPQNPLLDMAALNVAPPLDSAQFLPLAESHPDIASLGMDGAFPHPERYLSTGDARFAADTPDTLRPNIYSDGYFDDFRRSTDLPLTVSGDGPAVGDQVAANDFIFIDTAVSGYQALAAEWEGRGTIVFIDSQQDGVEQMLAALAGRENIGAIHIVSHGQEGGFYLGTSRFTAESVAGELSASLAALGQHLSSNGDILIYGCDVGAGSAGQAIVDAMAAATGADVAASVDDTGHMLRGGDWVLENRLGVIEGATLSAPEWDGLLALTNSGTWTIAGQTATTVVDGVTVTVTFSAQFNTIANQTFNTIDAFSNAAQGAASLQSAWTSGTGTITITFSSPMINPIINFDRIGGVVAGLSNSAQFTLTTAGATLTRLTGPSHFQVNTATGTITREVNVATANNGESSLTNSAGTAAGSVRINGTFTTITFSVAQAPGSAVGGDTFEMGFVLDAPPTAQNDAFTGTEDTTLSGSLFSNNGSGADSDPRNDTLTVTRINGATFTVGTPIVLASGTLTITNATTGAFTFVPNANVNGANLQGFTYTIADPAGNTSTANVTISINAVDDAPQNVVPATQNVAEDGTLVFSTANGNAVSISDAEGGVQTVTLNVTNGTLSLSGVAGLTFTAGDGTADTVMTFSGTVAAINQALQGLTYVPSADYNGPAQITLRTVTNPATATGFTNGGFELQDFADINNFRTVNESQIPGWDTDATDNQIEVWDSGYQGVPAYEGDQFVEINANQVGALFQNFQPTAGSSISVNFAHRGRLGVDVMQVVATDLGADGVLGTGDDVVLLNENFSDGNTAWGNYTRLITGSASGNIIRFEFRSVSAAGGSPSVGNFIDGVSILQGLADLDTININVTPVVDIVNDSATTPEDTAVTINLLANDSFENSGRTITAINGTAITAGGAAVTVTNGSVRLNADGTVTFTPTANYNGTASFTYTVSTANNAETATATVTITPVNDPVTTVGSLPARANVDAATGINVATAGAFADIDGPALTYSATGLPAGLTINATTGVITGTINRSASQTNGGVYNVVVTASDGSTSATQSFSWTVTNPGPTAVNDATLVVNEDTAGTTVNVLANDTDPDGDPLSIVSASATNGTVVVNGNGTITFTPNANYNGTATITYTISDGQGGTSTATVPVTVNAVNDAPTPVGTLPARSNVDAATGINVATASAFADIDGPALTYSATGLPAGLTINASTGVISGTIDRSASQGGTGGVYTVVVTASDGTSSATQSFSWTVTNPAPTAVNDATLVVNEDTAGTTVNLLANDSDPDGDPLTIVSASATNGTVVINANGTITFTPAANYNGSATITYTISDGQGGTSTATVPVTINAVNDAPTPVGTLPARNNVDGASGINVATASAFADVDGPALTYSATGLPAGLTINSSTGVISGTIDRSASQGGTSGVYNIVVTASDGTSSATQTFSWTITNPAPTAVNDATLVVNEDTPGTTVNLLANDSDPDGDPLTIVSATATNGTVVINANGTITFTPAANYNGSATITYTISDGQGGTSTATVPVTVNAVNDAPTPVGTLPARNNVDGASGISVATASAFADVDGPSATYSATGLPSGLTINSTTGVISGTINRSASQTNGGVYNVVVTRSDGSLSATQSFVWTVTNPAPTAANDTASTTEDTPIPSINVLGNDSDPDGDPLTVTSASATNGTVTINANGTLNYTPNANFNGTDTITYTISDGQGGTSTATVTVTVGAVNDAPTPVGSLAPRNNVDSATGINVPTAGGFTDVDNASLTYSATGLPPGLSINSATGVITGTLTRDASQGGSGGVYSVTVTATDAGGLTATQTFSWTVTNPPPVAVNDSATTNEDTTVLIPVLANDSDPDGDPLTVIAASASVGAATIAGNQIQYTPPANFNGTATITYTISDGNGGTATATVTITVNAVNDAPTATPIPARNTSDGASISVPVAPNFSDVDGDTLSFSATGLPAGLTINPTTGVISGTIAANASQTNGGVYTATITASDGRGGTVTQTITFNVANPPPVAANDNASTAEDTPVTISPLVNDTDPDGDPLTITAAAAPNGTVVINANGTITYTPNAGFNGNDTITYTISDGNGGTSTARVTVSVSDVNDVPVATGSIGNQTNLDSQPISLPVAGAFSDPDGDALTFSATGLPAGLSISATTGVISGTIDRSASQVNGGVYSITVTASDGRGGTIAQTFTWTVTNPAPVASNDTVTTSEDTPIGITVLANDVEPDGDPLTVISASAGSGTVVILSNGTLQYTPNPNFNGQDTIVYSISDGEGGVSTATVTVNVTAVNDAPTTSGLPNQNGDDGAAVSIPTAPAFSDVDGDALTFAATGLPPGLSINSATGVISGTLPADASQNGPYVVTVTATDPSGASVTTSFVFGVQNVPPVVTNDTANTPEDVPVTVAVLANDSDPDNDPLTITSASATNGTVVVNANGTVTFTPAPDFNGVATVTYTISDGQGGVATATLTINVGAVNDAPQSVPIPNVTNEDNQSVSVNTGDFFSDRDGDTLSYSVTGLPAGLGIDPATGIISGTIARNASQPNGGAYSVTVTATDPGGLTTSRTFIWTVTNPAPTAVNDSATTAEDTPIASINVRGNDTDPDGDPLTVTSATASNGTVTINPDGTLRYVPNANFNGTDTIVYTISDGNGGNSTAAVIVTVTPVNDAPVAVNDVATTNEDQPVTIGVRANDSDIDGDNLTVTAATSPNGTVVINPNGTITFTPNANFNGPATITYTISDGNGGTATATVNVTVNPVNDAPVANPNTASTNEDTPVNIAVLGNDTDVDGNPLTVTAASSPNGTVTINPDGTITYNPNPGFNGTDTITYTISDGQGGFSTSTVTVTVGAVNDAPVATPIATQNDNDSQTVSFSVAGNFSDPDGDILSFSATGLPAGLTINPATGVISGTINPAASQGGPNSDGVYTVAVTASDGNGGTVTTSFTYTVTNPAPVAANDTATTNEDTPVTVTVLANDTDPDGDPLTVTTASAINGAVVINADGTVTYTPNTNFNGTDTITYTISDGNGGTSTATVTVTVNAVNDAPTVDTPIANQSGVDSATVSIPVAGNFSDLDGNTLTFSATGLPAGLSINPATGVISGTIDRNASQLNGGVYTVSVTASDGNGGTVTTSFTYSVTNPAPVAVNDSATTNEDTPVTVTVLANDTDPDGDPLTVTSASAPNGTVVINANGTVTYTPNANFNGTDTITYTISDGNGGTSTATVTVTVNAVNDAPTVDTPIANQSGVDNATVSIPVAGNFSDLDGNTLTFSATGLPPGLTINAAGVISGTLTAGASQGGPNSDGIYTVSVTANDGNGGTVTTTFTYTVTNPAPVAANDTATTNEDTPVTISVLANDTDPDGDPLTVTSATAPNGTVVINANGTITYTPNANFNGTDTITYTISDGNGGTSTATVTVTVNAVNDAPTVDTPIANQSGVDSATVSIPVAGNFSDLDGNTLSFSATGLPAGLTINAATGVISGTIDRNASQVNGGVYTVSVTASDGNGGTVTTSFTYTVTNPAPVAANDTATTNEDTPVTVSVLANDTDPDGDPLTVTSATAPNGTVAINANGTVTYTPNANFNGTDTITYTISDGNGGTSTATVTVTVNAVNDAPTVDTPIANQSGVDSATVNIPVAGNFSDLDGNTLTFSATGLPAGLSINATTGVISGTINRNASQVNGGVYTVSVTASDGNGGTVTTSFTYTVTNPAPVAANDTATTNEDTPVTVSVLANDTDPDGDPLTVTSATAPNGTVVINGNGTVTYTPNANFNGTDTITYTISDGNGGTSTATVTVTVNAVNDAPTADPPLSPQTNNDADLVSFDVSPNFADVDGNTLTFTATGLPAGLSISAAGVITGTIDNSASQVGGGIYSVTVTASDGNGGTVTSTFTWTVGNPAPVAVNDIATTTEDTPVNISVLANDTDADGDTLTVTAASAPNGTVTIGAGGVLTYTPSANFTGTDVITYTISDGEGGTSTATVTVTISSANDAPTTAGLPNLFDTDSSSVSVPIASAFSDLDGDTLTFSDGGTLAALGLTIDPATGVISGTIPANASTIGGGVYTITITASDGNGGSVSTTFTWTITNVGPDAVDDTASTNEDTAVTFAVLGNDTDPDNDVLTVVSASATNGTVVVNANGTLTYTPNADFNGTATVTYQVTDGNGGFSTATAVITVAPVNDAPDATPLADRTNLDGDVVNIPAGAQFSDRENDTLSFSATGLPAGLSINTATGAITGTIDRGASQLNGGVYTVTVTASDGNGGTTSISFVWSVANPGPTAVNDTASTGEETPVNISVLANDTDPDGDVLTVTTASAPNGTVTIGAGGVLTYTPDANFNGTDTITYTISDGNGGTSTATVTVTVGAVNDAPTATPLPARSSPDSSNLTGPNAINVAGNFVDADGNTLTFTATGLPPGLSISSAGVISGTIAPSASQGGAGGIYTVTVTANDGNGGTVSTTFSWTVTNPSPVAVNDAASTTEDAPVNISVLANDTDPDGDPLTVTIASAGNGTVTIGAGGVLTYTPNANFNGTDTITYTISDGNGGTSTATVTVTVGAVNDAPTATPLPTRSGADSTNLTGPNVINVAGNFADADGNTLTFTATGLPPGLSISPAGVISGTIAPSASQGGAGGVYTVTVTASDGNGGTVSSTFSWTITNPPPVATNDTVSTTEDTPANISVLANDIDPDGDPLTVTNASAPNGTVTIGAGGLLTYTPNANFNGTDTITYTISDGNGGTSTATVTVTVGAVNDAPTASPLPTRSNVDSTALTGPAAIDVSGSFDDLDGDTLTFSATGLPPGLSISPAGVISGTIAPNASQGGAGGIYTVTVTASDGNGGTVSTTFSWTVTNPTPVAVNDNASTNEDTPVAIPVLTNDSDPDGDPLTVTNASAGNGTVTIGAGGVLTYTPNANFNGTDTITYTIGDGNGGTSTATVTVTVAPVNDAPVAGTIPDQFNVDGGLFTGNAAPFFSDVDGDTLTYSATGLPAGLSIDPATGIVSGRIASGASQVNGGVYTITITATDGNGGSASTTFTGTVTNPPPVAVNDSAATSEDFPVNINVLANDNDPDGDALTVTTASAANGTVTILPNGTIDYTPNANFNGTDTITYTISDGNGGTATATVTVTVGAVNDAPVAVNDSTSTNEDVPVTIAVLANDSDVDGNPLTVTSATAANGTVVINPNGTITYTPNANFNGTDTITYVVSDGQGGTATATVTVDVSPVNDAPVAVNDTASTPEDAPVTIAVLANDVDVDGNPLTVTAATSPNGSVAINPDGTITFTPTANFNGTTTVTYTISDGNGGVSTATVTLTVAAVNDVPVANPSTATTSEDTPVILTPLANVSDADGNPLTVTAASATNGTVTINPDGTLRYVPNANFNGTDVVTYTVSDGQGGTVTSTITVTVSAVNDAPVAVNDTATTIEDTPVTIPVLANDTDAEGSPLTVTAATSPNGTVVINPDGTITFTPNANFSGPTTITYTVSDGQGGTATGTVTLNVTAVNDAPVAGPDTATTAEDTPVTIAPLANDSDADGNPLTITAATSPNGTVVINPNGTITFTPDANFNGPTTITYTVSDGQGGTATATITLNVTPVNDAPVARTDVFTMPEDTTARIPVLANDSDAEGDPLTVTAATSPNGTVVINADGTLSFTPTANFSGPATITYTISDGRGGTATATVTVNVVGSNDAPVDGDESVFAIGGAPLTINVLANTRDPDGDPLSVFFAGVDSGPGSVVINPDGTITYTAPADYQGEAVIRYIVSDGRGGFDVSFVTVTVTQANADINALLGNKNGSSIPDGWLVDEIRDQRGEFIEVPLIVDDTVNEFRGLNGTPFLFGDRPLLTAINGLGWLRGTPDHGTNGHPVTETVAYLDRIQDLRFGQDRLFDQRWGDFFVKSLTGFSVRQLDTGVDQLMVESVVRDQVIYIEVRDIGADSDPRFVRYELRTRDGTALPDWIRMDQRGLAIVERPVDADEIRLVIRGIREDGKIFEIPILVQGATGEIQLDTPLSGKKIGAADSLVKTLAAASAAANDEAALLAAAFSSKA